MYGIEIEYGGSNFSGSCDANEYLKSVLNEGFWVLKTDCSVDIGDLGMETVSRIPTPLDILEIETLSLAQSLRREGFETDDGDSAGIHIHIGMDNYTRASCYNLRMLITRIEEQHIGRIFGRRDGEYHYAEINGSPDHKFQRCSIRREFNTIEVRAFASTFNHNQLKRYFRFIRFCTGLLESNCIDENYDLATKFLESETVCV